MSKAPMVAGTMQTDPRSGGVKRSSGVNVLPEVAEGMYKTTIDPPLKYMHESVGSLEVVCKPILEYGSDAT